MDDSNNKGPEVPLADTTPKEDKVATFTVKTTESVKERLDKIAKKTNSPKNAVFAAMIDLYELKVSNEVFNDFTLDIEEFQSNTERLFRSFVQMIERSVAIRENENKNSLTRAELQEQITKNNEKHQATIDDYLEKLEQLRKINEAALNKQEESFNKERSEYATKIQALEEALTNTQKELTDIKEQK